MLCRVSVLVTEGALRWTQGQGRWLAENCSVCLFNSLQASTSHPPGCSSLGLLQLALPAVLNKGMDANPPSSQPSPSGTAITFFVVALC